MSQTPTQALFARDDINGFWALFADNLANMVIISTICLHTFHMPASVVFGKILPGVGIALLVGLGFYAQLARRLAEREGRTDVTALPYGISTPVLFVYLFGVMMPVYLLAKKGGMADADAGMMAWRVAMAAAFIGGALECAGALIGPFLKEVTPRAGMLGTLAGIALVYIATVPLAEIFEHPIIGLPALAIVLIGLVARVRLPFGLPAGLVAILVGVLMAALIGHIPITPKPFAGVGLYPPLPLLGDLFQGLKHLFIDYPFLLAVVFPIEIYNFIETMNNVESAEAAGDAYPVHVCQTMDGVGTMAGAVFGGPFPTTVYIGHPAYKQLGARVGYALGVGVVFFCIACFGLMNPLFAFIPVAAVAPILVYVGITICGQAFQASPATHGLAVAIAMLPHLSDLLSKKVGGALRETSTWLLPHVQKGNDVLQSKLSALQSEALPPDLLKRLLLEGGIHYQGQLLLSKGAILVGLIWGAITANLIDRKGKHAAGFAAAGALLALLGLLHSLPGPGLHYNNPLVYGYLLLALCCYAIQWMPPEETLPDAETLPPQTQAAAPQTQAAAPQKREGTHTSSSPGNPQGPGSSSSKGKSRHKNKSKNKKKHRK